MRVIVWAFALILGGAGADAAPPLVHEPSAAPEEELSEQDAARLNALIIQIEETNQQIDARFEEIMEELQIVKVRASIKRPEEEP